MYKEIHLINDIMKEKYLYGSELVGKYGFPKLEPCNIFLPDETVPFNMAKGERNPKKKICHFFIDDYQFQRIWNDADKYMGILKNFGAVCSPDFSLFEDMPLAMQIWNLFRSRSLAYYMQQNGVKIIPTVGWTDKKSFSWCFDGLPKHSILAVSTNGCFSEYGKKMFAMGFEEMSSRLLPKKVIIIGYKMDLIADTEIVWISNGRKR